MDSAKVDSCKVAMEPKFYYNVGALGFPDVCARCGGGAKLLKGQREGQKRLYKTVRPLCSDPTCIAAGWVTRGKKINRIQPAGSISSDVVDVMVPDYFPINVAKRGRKPRGGVGGGTFDNGIRPDNHPLRWTQEQLDKVRDAMDANQLCYICLEPTEVGDCLVNCDLCVYRRQYPSAFGVNGDPECGTVFHEHCYANKWHFPCAEVDRKMDTSSSGSDSDSDSDAQAEQNHSQSPRKRRAVRALFDSEEEEEEGEEEEGDDDTDEDKDGSDKTYLCPCSSCVACGESVLSGKKVVDMCACSAVVHLDCLKLNDYYCPLCHAAAWPEADAPVRNKEDDEEEEGDSIDLTGQ
jgi:hypothetical protein